MAQQRGLANPNLDKHLFADKGLCNSFPCSPPKSCWCWKVRLATARCCCGFLSILFHFIFRFRKNLHEGVIRDVERQKRRRVENLYNLQQQIDLTKELKKQQEKLDIEMNPNT